MRKFNWVSYIFAAGLGGCSLYPIPDDVSPFRTEQIVRYARCEVRSAILVHLIRRGMIDDRSTAMEIRSQIEATKAKAKKNAILLTENEKQLLRLTKVAMVYSFDFNITENNKASAGAGFKLPGLTNTLEVGGTTALDLTRIGSRVFGTEDSWDELITNSSLCENWPGPRPANAFYPLTGSIGFDPLTGSIGVGRVVETFIDIDLQGGAKDNFVDTLTFTTSVGGDTNASVKLDPVPNQFRLVSATADVGASRLDVHKLTISLAFPQPDVPKGGIAGVTRVDGDLNAPFERPAAWRARYNLCVQDARTRENAFKQLRLSDPVVYCIAYADEFAPQYGRGAGKQTVVTTTSTVRRSAAPGGPTDSAGPETTVTTTTTPPRVRPNLRPLIQ
ncbi:hypothetical protein ACVIWU_006706 [Bradyrhizobium sp. USDA 4509]